MRKELEENVFWKVILKHLTPETQNFIKADIWERTEKSYAQGMHDGIEEMKKESQKNSNHNSWKEGYKVATANHYEYIKKELDNSPAPNYEENDFAAGYRSGLWYALTYSKQPTLQALEAKG